MTASIYQEMKLVQVKPGTEWYVAIPHPYEPGVLAVDVDKDLTFSAAHAVAAVTAAQDVPAFNRFIPLRIELIPGALEASAFSLLLNLLYQAIEGRGVGGKESDARQLLLALTLRGVRKGLGQGLHEALTRPLEREERLCVEHDFLMQQVRARQQAATRGRMGSYQQDAAWGDE